jgi:Zinc finger, C2H2 type
MRLKCFHCSVDIETKQNLKTNMEKSWEEYLGNLKTNTEKSWEEYLGNLKTEMEKSWEKYSNNYSFKGRKEDSDSVLVNLTHVGSLSDVVEIENGRGLVGGSNSENRNVNTETIRKKNKRFTCFTCKKTYSRKQYLKTHIKTVHEGKKLCCEFCDKLFFHQGNIYRHIKTIHEGKKLFRCSICMKSFNQKSSRDRHVETIHKRRKPIKCSSVIEDSH